MTAFVRVAVTVQCQFRCHMCIWTRRLRNLRRFMDGDAIANLG
jgi:molybdenum cofactor biosynthesis enzyme MoaA